MPQLLLFALLIFMPVANAATTDANTTISIEYLANHPEWAPQLAAWTYNAWHSYNPDLTEENALANIKTRMNTDKIPLTLVAVEMGAPVGMANLKREAEVQGLPKDKVWVGSFYVEPQHPAAAEMLLHDLNQQAIKFHLNELWVWESNPQAPAFYQKHGWKIIKKLPFKNHTVTVLKISL
jgi:GNAT superfamily N-acetyltransferase